MGSEEASRVTPAGNHQRGIDRRRVLEIIGSGATVTALAGCSEETSGTSNGDSSADDDGSTNATEANGTGDAAADEPTGDGDESESDDTNEDDADDDTAATFDIGLLAPLETQMGRSAMRCARIAVDECNDAGGVRDREVVLHARETEMNPNTAVGRADELLTETGVDLLVGTFDDDVSRAVIERVAGVDVPFLVTGAADPTILTETVGRSYDTYRNVFRTGPLNRDVQVEGVADYAEFLQSRTGLDEFALLFETEPWAQPVTETLSARFRDRGLEIVTEHGFPSNTRDFAPFLHDIEENGADTLLRFTTYADETSLLDAWQTNEFSFTLEGISVPASSADYWTRTDGNCRYTITGRTVGSNPAANDRKRSLVRAYESRVGNEQPPSKPMEMGFTTYDAIHCYATAVAEAGTADHETDLDAIVDAMLSLDHEGAAGEISLFGETGTYPHDLRPVRDGSGRITNFRQLQWQSAYDGGGRQECIFPEQYATANYVSPHWL